MGENANPCTRGKIALQLVIGGVRGWLTRLQFEFLDSNGGDPSHVLCHKLRGEVGEALGNNWLASG